MSSAQQPGFSFTPIRRQLDAVATEAATLMCGISLGDYATYRDAGKLALQPNLVLAPCRIHGTRHLYERDLWQTWLNNERATIMMALPLDMDEQSAAAARLFALQRIREVRLAQLRLELPFYAWQRDKVPAQNPGAPAGMAPGEYRRLTAEPLILQVAAMPDELLLEFHQCARKTRFQTIRETETFRHKKIVGGMASVREQEPYNCPHCGGLHLGKPRNDGSSHFYAQNQLRNAKRSWQTFHAQANAYASRYGLVPTVKANRTTRRLPKDR